MDYADAVDPRHSGQANVGEYNVRLCRVEPRESVLHSSITMNTTKPVRSVDERCQTFAHLAQVFYDGNIDTDRIYLHSLGMSVGHKIDTLVVVDTTLSQALCHLPVRVG